MEPPVKAEGPASGVAVRDGKVAVLRGMEPIRMEDVVLGQYIGYTDDETIKNKDSNTPTFAVLRMFVNTPRW